MAIIINAPTATFPKGSQNYCPFCECEKEIRFESFNDNTGQIDIKINNINSYKSLIIFNTAQPDLKDKCKPIECYCPQCYISFGINKSLGIF